MQVCWGTVRLTYTGYRIRIAWLLYDHDDSHAHMCNVNLVLFSLRMYAYNICTYVFIPMTIVIEYHAYAAT